MKQSSDRILTTHVGSLPRPQPVVELLLRKERGESYDRQDFDGTVAQAIRDVVARQAAIGIDVVSDGELSKIGYSTYLQDRLSGFGGSVERRIGLDLAAHLDYLQKLDLLMGKQAFRRASCVGPVALIDRNPLECDIENLRAAAAEAKVVEVFVNSASPGLVSAFQPNAFYPSHEAYVEAVADATREEYEAIVAAGFVLQLDCPDLAMARHMTLQDLTDAEFLKRAAFHVEVLNHALARIPAGSVRMHICWGNYEGPHDHDIPLDRILHIVLRAKPGAISFEAANPRHEHEWTIWRDAKLPDDKVLLPGVIDSTTNFVEHPELVAQRICRFADTVGRERVLASNDCGFGTFAGYGKMDPDMSYKKLRALVARRCINSFRRVLRSITPTGRTGR